MTSQIISIVEPGNLDHNSLKNLREGLHVSHSQITTYMLCPEKFRFQYVQGLQPEYIASALPFGSAIHHALAILYKQLQATDQAPSKKEMQEVFAGRWDHEQNVSKDFVRLKKTETWEGLLDLGVGMIGAYYDHADSMSMLIGENVVCVEHNFLGVLGEMDFLGVVDLILRDSNDPSLFHLIDHKTAARRYDETKIVTDMQLTAYKWLVEQSDYLPEDSALTLNWDVILKLKKAPVVERYTTVRNEKAENVFLATARSVLRAIENDIFYPNTGWMCSDCGFKRVCGAW